MIAFDKTGTLTGDDRVAAQAIAAEMRVDDVRVELLPGDKVTAIEELVRTHVVSSASSARTSCSPSR